MNFIETAVRKFARPQREPELTDIVTLGMTRDALIRQLQTIEDMQERLEGHDWRWFVEKYLPAESIRIAVEACNIENMDPLYERKKLIADAQIRQNNNLIAKLGDVRLQISTLRDQVHAIEARIESLNKKRSQ